MIDELAYAMGFIRMMEKTANHCKLCNKGVRPTKYAIAKGLNNRLLKAKSISYKILHNRVQRHK